MTESTRVTDLSTTLGARIVGAPTAWRTERDGLTVERIAGRSPNGALLVCSREQAGDWRLVNVTQRTRVHLGGPLTSWQTSRRGEVFEHLAGTDANGDLIEFRYSPRTNWETTSVTAATNARFTGSVTSWQATVDGVGVERLAGQAANGDLIVCWRDTAGERDWRQLNLSRRTRARISGPVAAWVTTGGGEAVEHLAGRAPNGDLLVFSSSPQEGWTVANVTAETGERISGSVTAWLVADDRRLAERVAAVAGNGDLLVFTRTTSAGWRVRNVSRLTGEKVVGTPSAFKLPEGDGLVEVVAARDARDQLIVHRRRSSGAWEMVNLTASTGWRVGADPCGWGEQAGWGAREHVAVGSLYHALLVFEGIMIRGPHYQVAPVAEFAQGA